MSNTSMQIENLKAYLKVVEEPYLDGVKDSHDRIGKMIHEWSRDLVTNIFGEESALIEGHVNAALVDLEKKLGNF